MNWKAVSWILATIICDICALYFGYTSLWTLGFFLTLVLVIAVILILCSFWMLSFRQVLLHPAVEKHTEAQLAVQCHNRGIFLYPNVQLYYQYQDKKRITVYPGTQEIRVGYVFSRKGQYRIGLKKIVVYEPFGIFCRRIRIREPEILYVLPRAGLVPMDLREDTGKSSEEGTKKKQVADRSTISDLREYEYGDTLNSINWKATAKRNEVIVNRYENEFCTKVFVYVDGSLQVGDSLNAAAVLDDYACDLAITCVKSVLNQDGMVTLFYGGRDRVLESSTVKSFQEYGIYLTEDGNADPERESRDAVLLEKTLFQKDIYNRATFYLRELTPEIARIGKQLENQHVKVEMYRIAVIQDGGKARLQAVLVNGQEGVDTYGGTT